MIQRICKLLFSLLLVVIAGCVVFLPLKICRTLLDIFLGYKKGEKYAGLLGVDTLFTTQRNCFAICLLWIDFDGEQEDFIVEVKRNIVERICHSGFKLSSTIENSMGFQYYLKAEINVEDAACFIGPECLTKDELTDYLEGSLHSPISNKAQWEVRIGTQPLMWTKQYPVIIRIQHSHGDGMTLLRILQKCFSEDEVLSNDYKEKRDKQLAKNNSHNDVIDDLLEFEKTGLFINIFKRTQRIPKFGTAQSAQLAIFCEERERYVPLIKKIKKRIGNVTFTEVLIAALVGSLCNYFRAMQMENGPKSLATCVTTTTRFTDVFLEKNDSNHRHTNNASAWQALVPLKTELKSVMDHMKIVHKVCTPARTSICNELSYWGMHLLTSMPVSFSKYFFKNSNMHPNLLVSNIPGLKLQTMRGHKVEDMIIFLEDYRDIEFIFVIGTYTERLQLTLNVKKGVLKNNGDVHRIMEDVLKHLDNLEEETRSL